MKKVQLTVLSPLIAVFIGLVSCKDDNSSSEDSHKLNGITYKVLETGTLKHAENGVLGTGSIIVVNPTKDKDNHYSLSFTLEDQGSLLLTANADQNLKNGISVQFSRFEKRLGVLLKNDNREVDISSKFTDVDASGNLSFQLDLHNGENPTHILIWSNVTDYSEQNAKFNSEEGAEAPGQGTGDLWGLVLNKSSVGFAAVSEAKYREE